MNFNKNTLKRGIDVIGSAIGLCATLPITALTTAALLIQNKGDVFFKQERTGLHGKKFNVYKFRTMSKGTEDITPIGNFLRRHSIDELPQLVNVLKGDMSLIGPRPMSNKALDIDLDTLHENPWLSEDLNQIQQIKPGLASLYAVLPQDPENPNNWRKRLDTSAFYAQNANTLLDLWIMKEAVRVSICGRTNSTNSTKQHARLSEFLKNSTSTQVQALVETQTNVPTL